MIHIIKCLRAASIAIVAGCLTLGSAVSPAISAVATNTEFSNPELVTIQGYAGTAQEPYITADGKYLIFNIRDSATGSNELYYATRTDDYKTFVYVGAVQGIGQTGLEAAASVDAAGNMYFLTGRSYPFNYISIWHGLFNNGNVTNLYPVQGLSKKTPGWFNMDLEISHDGKTGYFSDNDATTSTLVVATKNWNGSFTKLPNSAQILKNVNDLYGQHIAYAPCISDNGLELYFTAPTPGTGGQIYVAKRSTKTAAFGLPELVGAAADGVVEGPTLSKDMKYLYYHKLISFTFAQIYVVRRP